jgi:hypothetical protein
MFDIPWALEGLESIVGRLGTSDFTTDMDIQFYNIYRVN